MVLKATNLLTQNGHNTFRKADPKSVEVKVGELRDEMDG